MELCTSTTHVWLYTDLLHVLFNTHNFNFRGRKPQFIKNNTVITDRTNQHTAQGKCSTQLNNIQCTVCVIAYDSRNHPWNLTSHRVPHKLIPCYPHPHGRRVQYLVCVCVCLSVCLCVPQNCCKLQLSQNLNKLQVTNLVI